MDSGDNTTVISLRGWHPAIARAEAKSMFIESNLIRTDARRLIKAEGESDWSRANIMSGCECVLIGGGMMKWTSIEDFLKLINCEKRTDMAVECWRHEGKLPIATKEIEMQVGGMFHDKGSTFDLENPKHRFGVVLDASAGYVAWGWIVGQGPGKQGWATMRANKRPFFRPVSLEPRLARAAVNIAAGANDGYVVDPMCGTGGILIESALCNRLTLGVDFDPIMVDGAKENLDWAGVKAEVRREDATRFELPKNLAAVVVDPPYGRNSQGDETLLEDTLKNICRQRKQCSLVVILPCEPGNENLDEEISSNVVLPGFEIESVFGIPVHKSLGRILIIASISTQE
jgi:tRNA (guanine10-N2)-dimethyltransferase